MCSLPHFLYLPVSNSFSNCVLKREREREKDMMCIQCTHDVDELDEGEAELDVDSVGHVLHGPDELVVAAEEIAHEPLLVFRAQPCKQPTPSHTSSSSASSHALFPYYTPHNNNSSFFFFLLSFSVYSPTHKTAETRRNLQILAASRILTSAQQKPGTCMCVTSLARER